MEHGDPAIDRICNSLLLWVIRMLIRDHLGSVEILLERSDVELTEDIFCVAAEYGSQATMNYLLQQPRSFTVTQQMICRAGLNSANGEPMIPFLLHSAPGMQPFNELIEAVTKHPIGADILQKLIEQFGSVPVSLEALKNAASSYRGNAEVILEILFRMDTGIPIPPIIFVAARHNYGAFELLVKYSGESNFEKIFVDKSVIADCDFSILKSILGHHEQSIVTKEVLSYAATVNNSEVIDLLLRSSGLPTLPIKAFIALASNLESGYELLRKFKSLFDQLASQDINEMVSRAAENSMNGIKILKLLRSNLPMSYNQEALKSAVSNETYGIDMLKLMLNAPSPPCITQEIIVAGAKNRVLALDIVRFLVPKVMDLLPTQELLEAAAGNCDCGDRLLRFLFAEFSSTTPLKVNEEVLEAAAQAKPLWEPYDRGQSVRIIRSAMKTLISHPTANVSVSTLRTAAANEYCGRELVEDLFTHPKNKVVMDEAVLEAAISNGTLGVSLVSFIVEQTSTLVITERMLAKAALNTTCSKQIFRILLETEAAHGQVLVPKLIEHIREGEHGMRDALFHAAYKSNLAAIRILLSHGANIDEQAELIGNALHIAAFRGQFSSVELLLHLGADVNVIGGPHRNALLAACHRSKIEVAQCLLRAGADLECPDLAGRTALHRCIRGGHIASFDSLIILGASII